MDSEWSPPETDVFLSNLSASPFDFNMAAFDSFEDTSSPLNFDTLNTSPDGSPVYSDLGSPVNFDPLGSGLNSKAPEMAQPWSFESLPEKTTAVEVGRTNGKRHRNNRDGDDINACWKSPLCSKNTHDGGPPDSCLGECMDRLFADSLSKDTTEISVMPSVEKANRRISLDSLNDQIKNTSSSSPASSPTSESSIANRPVAKVRLHTSRSIDTPIQEMRPKGRVPHNQVEKRYRENVNAQLEALRRVVPVSRQQLSGFDGLDIEDLGCGARQPSKAVVLSSATAFIKQLEKDIVRMQDEIGSLKVQNKTLQSLVKCEDCSLMSYLKQSWKIAPVV